MWGLRPHTLAESDRTDTAEVPSWAPLLVLPRAVEGYAFASFTTGMTRVVLVSYSAKFGYFDAMIA